MATKEHFESKNNTVIEYALGFKHKQQQKYVYESVKASSQNNFTNLTSHSANFNSSTDSSNKIRSNNDSKVHQNWFDNSVTKTRVVNDYQALPDSYTLQSNSPLQESTEQFNFESKMPLVDLPETQQYIIESKIPIDNPPDTQQYIIREIYVTEPVPQKKLYSKEIIEPKNTNVYQKEVFYRDHPKSLTEKFYLSESKMKSIDTPKTANEKYDGEACDLFSKGYEKMVIKLFGSKKCCLYVTVVTVGLILAIIAFILFCLLYGGVLNKSPTYLQSCTASNPCVTNKNLYCNGTCVCSGIQNWNGTYCG
jgi:hypothetical protein